MLGERARSAHEFGYAAGEGKSFAFDECIRGVLAVAFDEFRLVIENVEVGWAS